MELVIVGDEAYTREEYEYRRRLRRAQWLRYSQKPGVKERRAELARQWKEANPERWREIKRESRRRRAPVRLGSLHSLACLGPTRATGCRCYEQGTRKIPVYRRKAA